MQMMVGYRFSSIRSAESWRIKHPIANICYRKARGYPKSESMAQGRPPRILSPEEQEKMRVACKVCSVQSSELFPINVTLNFPQLLMRE